MVRFQDAPQRRREINPDGLEILVHSRLEHFKNIDTVLRGFQQFCEQSSGAHHLHVVGEGREREFLEGLARDLALTRRVTFHGYLPEEELSRVYERCDVRTLLTLDEPFGMVFPEAAARGLLLIGPDHGGPLEILEGGALGWCVPALSSEALCVALQEVRALSACDVARRRRAADRSCRERFGREAIGHRLSELLVEACPV
jgi:glycosyltransferase involved in cell wall biosynthesis